MLWYPVALLPNFQIAAGGSIAAGPAVFASITDDRVRAVSAAHPVFKDLLSRFVNAFERKHDPSVLMFDPSCPDVHTSVQAMASMRDILSASVVPLARARFLNGRQTGPLCFSNAFDFYPWMIDQQFADLVMLTPGTRGIDDVSDFRGQLSPEFVIPASVGADDIDRSVFDALVSRWCAFYSRRNASSRQRSLLRSLNMAHHAGQLPGNQDTTAYDYGRLIALWVGALEILAHPGKGRVDFWTVCDLLEDAQWDSLENRRCAFKIRGRKKHSSKRRRRVCRVYESLYDARNDFLHGNRIYGRAVYIGPKKVALHKMGALLYRTALSAFLKIRRPSVPSESETMDIWEEARHISDSIDYRKVQMQFEDAFVGCGTMRRSRR